MDTADPRRWEWEEDHLLVSGSWSEATSSTANADVCRSGYGQGPPPPMGMGGPPGMPPPGKRATRLYSTDQSLNYCSPRSRLPPSARNGPTRHGSSAWLLPTKRLTGTRATRYGWTSRQRIYSSGRRIRRWRQACQWPESRARSHVGLVVIAQAVALPKSLLRSNCNIPVSLGRSRKAHGMIFITDGSALQLSTLDTPSMSRIVIILTLLVTAS